jgi:hypothetical protein
MCCVTRWKSLYHSILKLLEKRSILLTLMLALNLPFFKDLELDFLEEYRWTFAPIAVALDRLLGGKTCYNVELLTPLFMVNSQLTNLHSVHFSRCTPLLIAVSAVFQRRLKHS